MDQTRLLGGLPDLNFVSHLECGLTGQRFKKGQVLGLSHAGKPLLVHYDLNAIRDAVRPSDLIGRCNELWRYRELLPFQSNESIVRLGEPVTPLIPLPISKQCDVLIKDEGRLPTGSFKARGLCMAVTMANELGIKRIAMPTNGNAGAALSAYASRAGIESFVFCPDDTPEINVREIAYQGGHVWKANGLIHQCGKVVGDGKETMGWFDMSTLKEPYRIEGKKTMGLELAEQFGWALPDVIFYPTGGGTGLIGMWKAFSELKELGWITGKLPRMVAVQAAGCAPIVRAFDAGEEFAEPWENAHTVAAGIRVPAAVGDFLILRAVRESGGRAVSVTDSEIVAASERSARQGVMLCPEGAATLAACENAISDGWVEPSERIVLFNCATGLKYPLPEANRSLDIHNVDYSAIGDVASHV